MPFVAADGTVLRGQDAAHARTHSRASSGKFWQRFVSLTIALACLVVLLNPDPMTFYEYARRTPMTSKTIGLKMCAGKMDDYYFFTTVRCGGKRYLGILGIWTPWPKFPLLEEFNASLFKSLDDIRLLIGLNVLVFILWIIAPVRAMTQHFTISRRNLEQGRVHTLLTAGFSHMDLPHLILNLISLVSSTQLLLTVISNQEFWGLYLTCIIGGCVVSLLYHSGDRCSLGASGGVFGILGFLATVKSDIAFIWHGLSLRPMQMFAIHLVLEGLQQQSTIDIAMHIGGAITGVCYCHWLHPDLVARSGSSSAPGGGGFMGSGLFN